MGFLAGALQGPQTSNRAELQALVALSGRVTGSLPVAVDSSYVARPFAADVDGAAGKEHTHIDPWGQLLEYRRAGRGTGIELYKIKSHMHATVAAERRVPWWAWWGNFIVDELAGRVAGVIQFPPAVTNSVSALDEKASLIQKRLANVIAEAPARKFGKLPKKQDGHEGQQEEAPPEAAAAAAEVGQHVVKRLGNLYVCRCCRRGDFVQWPQQECKGQQWSLEVHQSHELVAMRGILLCACCGAWAKHRVLLLAQPCRRPQPAGKAALRAIQMGKCPPGLPSWPW